MTRLRMQQLTPTLRRIWAGDTDPRVRIPDPALGDWARGLIAATPWVELSGLDELAHGEHPSPLRTITTGAGVRMEFSLARDEQLYGACDADAAGLARRGEHVHLITEMHPRGRHPLAAPCALCEEDAHHRVAADVDDDYGNERSSYAELHAPFVISSAGYAAWISNATSDGLLDLGRTDPDIWSFAAPGGHADVYLFGPADVAGLSRSFSRFTGGAPSPPAWALGYLQSRFGFESFDHVDAVIDRFEAESLPVHGVILDVQWLEQHVNLRWNPDGFEHAEERIRSLKARGVRTTVITEPGTRVDADNFAPGEELGAWATLKDGRALDSRQWYACEQIKGYRRIKPIRGALLNPFREDVFDWWYDQHKPLLAAGVDAWWLDLNEPEGSGAEACFPQADWPVAAPMLEGSDVRNIFALAQQRAFARRDRAHDDRRSVLLTRSGHAGSARYGAAPWSGDIGSTWPSMRVQPRLMLNAGLCGFPLYGCDIGGFHGDPDPELFARWLQLGSVMPVCRAHGCMHDREPWSQGEAALEAARPALVLRSQLLPSICSWLQAALDSGEPLCRPMVWNDPSDPRWHDCWDQWYLGPMLVAPVLHPGATSRTIQLPAGSWVGVWDGVCYDGDTEVTVMVDPATIPMFVPVGTALIVDPTPLARRGTSWPPAELEIWAFPDDDGCCSATLRVDDGATRQREQGAYCTVDINVTPDGVFPIRTAGAWPIPRVRLAEAAPGVIRDHALETR